MDVNTAVAVTVEICRTVLWLAVIAGVVLTVRPVLPRFQVAAQRPGKQQPETRATTVSAFDAALARAAAASGDGAP